jgi:hypothetical protein
MNRPMLMATSTHAGAESGTGLGVGLLIQAFGSWGLRHHPMCFVAVGSGALLYPLPDSFGQCAVRVAATTTCGWIHRVSGLVQLFLSR